jgi:hypothetical protein
MGPVGGREDRKQSGGRREDRHPSTVKTDPQQFLLAIDHEHIAHATDPITGGVETEPAGRAAKILLQHSTGS